MGFLDRLLGREARETYPPPASGAGYAAQPAGGASPDERAVARYRYLLRTAPPESLEQVHAEAFAQLNPEQRRQVLAELSRDLPAGEQAPSDDPQSMARFATRAELRRPGYLEQAFGRRAGGGGGGGGMGMGMGGTVMGSMMGTMAGVVVGSMVANALLDDYDSSPEASEVGDGGAAADGSDSSGDSGDSSASGDANDTGATGDASGDASAAADSGFDSGGQDSGGDSGSYDAGGFDSGGFGGGDFGGGSDFGGGGGGDFGGGF